MTLPDPEAMQAELDRQVAARTADLAELLGHVSMCWDEERRLLARKMHDTLGSSMTALTMHLALLTQQMPKDKNLQDRGAQMKTLLMNIINTNRDMQLSLWNDKLEFLGIKAAIAELVTEFGHAQRMTTRVSLPDEDAAVPRAHSVALLRCVEEGLRNVAAHARASEVDVILDDNDEEVMLTVRDNGVGLQDGKAGHDCHGLRLLAARASHLGGTLAVRPGPHGGTLLTVILPKTVSAA